MQFYFTVKNICLIYMEMECVQNAVFNIISQVGGGGGVAERARLIIYSLEYMSVR